MLKISASNLTVDEYVDYYLIGKVRERCTSLNLSLEAGKVYCLDGMLGYGGWGFSWCLSGIISQFRGEVLVNGESTTQNSLKKISCSVGLTGFEGTLSANKSVRKLLMKAISSNSRINTISELKDIFMLADSRLDRSIRSYSGERWRVSLALGFGAGKKVFCFPWLKPEFIYEYKEAWIKQMVDFLRNEGCLVIIPTIYNDDTKELFDKVASFDYWSSFRGQKPVEVRDV